MYCQPHTTQTKMHDEICVVEMESVLALPYARDHGSGVKVKAHKDECVSGTEHRSHHFFSSNGCMCAPTHIPKHTLNPYKQRDHEAWGCTWGCRGEGEDVLSPGTRRRGQASRWSPRPPPLHCPFLHPHKPRIFPRGLWHHGEKRVAIWSG